MQHPVELDVIDVERRAGNFLAAFFAGNGFAKEMISHSDFDSKRIGEYRQRRFLQLFILKFFRTTGAKSHSLHALDHPGVLFTKVKDATPYFGMENQIVCEMNQQLRENVVHDALFKSAPGFFGVFVQSISGYEFEAIVIIAGKRKIIKGNCSVLFVESK